MDSTTKPIVETFFAMPTTELLARYRRGVENFDKAIFGLSDAQLDTAFLPEAGVGRWPVRVLLGHLADAEIVFSHRMRRAVAEDGPTFAVWDEQAFIDSGLYGGPEGGKAHPLAGFVSVIHLMRTWTGQWLHTLRADQWERKALHPERGEQTVRRIADYATWHLEHHNWFLRAKVQKLAGR
jgi:hypothetical protein